MNALRERGFFGATLSQRGHRQSFVLPFVRTIHLMSGIGTGGTLADSLIGRSHRWLAGLVLSTFQLQVTSNTCNFYH